MEKLDITRVTDIEVDGIDTRDYPDFCDSYMTAGAYKMDNGEYRDLTEDELEYINDNHRDVVYEAVIEHLH